MANISLDNGIVDTDGVDELGREYITHPDSGLPIKGFQIPRWDELVTLSYQLARVLPEQHYVGWDLALTEDKGWVMVEGNGGGQFIHQYATHKGARDIVNRFMR